MTLEPRTSSGHSSLNRAARSLRLAVGLIVLAIPLSGCGTGSLWDKFLAKDDTYYE
jgi:outer membrane protein assembly factor BamD